MRRLGRAATFVALTLAGGAGAVGAVDRDRDDDKAVEMTAESQAQATRIAKAYGVETYVVKDLRAQGLGWGEIKHALAISRRSGQPLSDVLKLRRSGLGWGEIAHKYGFTLGEATGKGAGRAKDADEHAAPGRTEAGERGGRGFEGRGREGRGPRR